MLPVSIGESYAEMDWIGLSTAAMYITFLLYVFMVFLVKKPSSDLLERSSGPIVEIFNDSKMIETSHI
jgi:hypothetical protein